MYRIHWDDVKVTEVWNPGILIWSWQRYERHRDLKMNLTAQQRDAMFSLLADHFDRVTREQFESDLEKKDWVLLLQDEAGNLAGFSTIQKYDTQAFGRQISVVYSGDTIVRRDAWTAGR